MSAGEFGKYRLIEKIGQGGMAEVFYAQILGQAGFTKEVALKRVLPHLCEDVDFVNSFVDEARLGGLLNHHHIVQTIDFGQIDGVYYMAMEYVHGLTLRDVFNFHNRHRQLIPPPVVLDLLLQLADGLRYAHAAEDELGNPLNMVHRDLKPTNILVSSFGVVKVADFGIARAETNMRRTAFGGVLKGTAQYMSPEQAMGDLNIDRRSDVFSIGSIAYEMVTLRPLFFDPGSSIKTLRNVQEAAVGDALALMAQTYSWTRGLVPLLERMLAREPADRPERMSEVIPQLRRIQNSLSRYTDTQGWIEQVLVGMGKPVRSRRGASSLSVPLFHPSASEAERAGDPSPGKAALPVDPTLAGKPSLPGVPVPPAHTQPNPLRRPPVNLSEQQEELEELETDHTPPALLADPPQAVGPGATRLPPGFASQPTMPDPLRPKTVDPAAVAPPAVAPAAVAPSGSTAGGSLSGSAPGAASRAAAPPNHVPPAGTLARGPSPPAGPAPPPAAPRSAMTLPPPVEDKDDWADVRTTAIQLEQPPAAGDNLRPFVLSSPAVPVSPAAGPSSTSTTPTAGAASPRLVPVRAAGGPPPLPPPASAWESDWDDIKTTAVQLGAAGAAPVPPPRSIAGLPPASPRVGGPQGGASESDRGGLRTVAAQAPSPRAAPAAGAAASPASSFEPALARTVALVRPGSEAASEAARSQPKGPVAEVSRGPAHAPPASGSLGSAPSGARGAQSPRPGGGLPGGGLPGGGSSPSRQVGGPQPVMPHPPGPGPAGAGSDAAYHPASSSVPAVPAPPARVSAMQAGSRPGASAGAPPTAAPSAAAPELTAEPGPKRAPFLRIGLVMLALVVVGITLMVLGTR